MRLEDLYDVQQSILDEFFKEGGENEYQLEDLVSQALYELTNSASTIVQLYHLAKFDSKLKIDDKIVKRNILHSLKFTTLLSYCFEIDLPELEEVATYADQFVAEVAVDAILSSYSVLRSTAEIGLCYYADEDLESEQVEQFLIEVFASLHLLAERSGTSLEYVLAGV
jgi:hypothetical protein